MPICQVSSYQVKPGALGAATDAATALAEHVQRHEQGTALYLVWQQTEDPTQFMHIAIFNDEEALDVHRASKAVRRFEKACEQVMQGGPIFLVEYDAVAGKPDMQLPLSAPFIPAALTSDILAQGLD